MDTNCANLLWNMLQTVDEFLFLCTIQIGFLLLNIHSSNPLATQQSLCTTAWKMSQQNQCIKTWTNEATTKTHTDWETSNLVGNFHFGTPMAINGQKHRVLSFWLCHIHVLGHELDDLDCSTAMIKPNVTVWCEMWMLKDYPILFSSNSASLELAGNYGLVFGSL